MGKGLSNIDGHYHATKVEYRASPDVTHLIRPLGAHSDGLLCLQHVQRFAKRFHGLFKIRFTVRS